MELGSKKEQEAKLIQVELNQIAISAVEKARLRERFLVVHKKILDGQKAQQKLETKKAIDAVTSYFQDPDNKDARHLVVKLPISANAKAVKEAVNHVKTKLGDKSVYVLAADEGEGKVAHGCYMAQVRFLCVLVYYVEFPRLMNASLYRM
jgi:alanyl-tRNA synthetase